MGDKGIARQDGDSALPTLVPSVARDGVGAGPEPRRVQVGEFVRGGGALAHGESLPGCLNLPKRYLLLEVIRSNWRGCPILEGHEALYRF